MRALLKLLVVLGAILAAAWIGGEMALARKAAALIAEDPQLEAAGVRELRDARRVGVRVEQLALAGPEGAVSLPWLDLWVPPRRPNQVHATLPSAARLTLDGRPVTVTLQGGAASASFAPANGFALGAARFGASEVALDGRPVAARVEASARLAGFGADAPRGAGAAYDVRAEIAGLSLAALTGGAAAGAVSAAGEGRLWLDRAPARGGSAEAPRLVGLRADGVELRLDDLTARLRGRVVADAEGVAQGEVTIDTADAQGFLSRAADLGLLPRMTVPLLTAALGGLSGGVSGPAATAAEAPATRPQAALPPPQDGALRIPIAFRDGRTWLGPLPVGPAPRFPR